MAKATDRRLRGRITAPVGVVSVLKYILTQYSVYINRLYSGVVCIGVSRPMASFSV